MIREVKEETGLDVRVVRQLPDHHYTSPRESEVTTTMFLVEPIDPHREPQTEHLGDSLCWVAVDEVSRLLTHDNLKNYFLGLKL